MWPRQELLRHINPEYDQGGVILVEAFHLRKPKETHLSWSLLRKPLTTPEGRTRYQEFNAFPFTPKKVKPRTKYVYTPGLARFTCAELRKVGARLWLEAAPRFLRKDDEEVENPYRYLHCSSEELDDAACFALAELLTRERSERLIAEPSKVPV